jgi:hypothetical protein
MHAQRLLVIAWWFDLGKVDISNTTHCIYAKCVICIVVGSIEVVIFDTLYMCKSCNYSSEGNRSGGWLQETCLYICKMCNLYSGWLY